MKLKAKINVYTVGMFILLLILLNFMIFFSFNRLVNDNEIDRAYAETLKKEKGINESEETIKIQDLLRAYLPVDGMFKTVNIDGKTMTTITDPDMQHVRNMPTQFYPEERNDIIKIDGISYVFISVPIITKEGDIANLQMVESLESTMSVLNTLKLILIVVSIIATILVFISSQILSNIISKPILSMLKTMGEIQKSGKHKQIQLQKRSKDELYQMGETFNAMIEQLEKNYENKEQFIMNASNELKTQINVIESYSNVLKRRGMEETELFEESIEAIHSEAIRMRELTQQLLLLTKNDAIWKMKMESISMMGMLNEVIRYFHSAFQCEIELLIRENIDVFVDQQKFTQLLYIFIENACKYSEGTVQIEVGQYNDEKGWLTISDDGIGIPTEDLDKVFDRFYRVDKARARKTGGFGLGLSLAKEIAGVMDIEIKMSSEEGKGTKVKLIFSLANYN